MLAALLLAHLAIGVFRVPGVVFARRWQDVADFRARGATGWFLAEPERRGADVVRWIVANVTEDGVVLCTGDSEGALEFVPGMIAPRLLVRAERCAADARSFRGRPLATRRGADGEPHVVVLHSRRDELRLEER